MKIKISILFFVFLAAAAVFGDTPITVMANRTNGVIRTPANLFTANIVPGTNVVFRTNSGQLTISASAASSGGTNVVSLGLLTNGILYVSAAAADDTGDGSVSTPYQSTTNALAHATNCTIYVTTGQYQWALVGRHAVNWYLDSDVIVGSSNITAGPIFAAAAGTNFSVSGGGQILATTTSVETTGSGTIRLDGVYVSPAITVYTNITGSYREP